MPSHLTRHVIRCMLANEPIIHAGCLRAAAAVTHHKRRQCRISQSTIKIPQRRTLFNFAMLTGQTRDQASISAEPGLTTMAELEKRKRLKARLPTVQEVAAAIKAFLSAKRKSRQSQLLDTQAVLLLQALRYVSDNVNTEEETSQDQENMQVVNIPEALRESLHDTANLLVKQTSMLSAAHIELAKFVQDGLQGDNVGSRALATSALVNVLSEMGKPAEARDVFANSGLLDEYDTAKLASQGSTDNKDVALSGISRIRQALVSILAAFARQNNEEDMLTALQLGERFRFKHSKSVLDTLVAFYVTQRDSTKLRPYLDLWLDGWVRQLLKSATDLDVSILRKVLTYAVQNNEPELGHSIVVEIMENNPKKEVWDEVLAFGFGMDKSVDEISRMMDVMVKSNADLKAGAPRRPDIATINRLVEVAITAGDPYLAERLITLGRSRNIEPDAQTLVLQMNYRLSVKDVDGALIAYKHLQSRAIAGEEDVPAVNDLIVALCHSSRHDFDTIMNVAADLSDRQAVFTAEAVQALAVVHLKRDEVQDVEDLVKTHAHRYTSEERAAIRNAIIDFVTLPDTQIATLWDSYQILRNHFDEAPRQQRTKMMLACFDKGRSDMAVHIFSHMRMHSRDDTYPDDSTYIAAFLGAAKTGDSAPLDALHNQLRLDINVDVTTAIRNALMIAQIAIAESRDAITTWNDIVDSREGPSYNSILIALRACQRAPGGLEKAEEIWARLRRNRIDLDQGLWGAYIAAIASNGNVSHAVQVLRQANAKDQVEVDAHVLGCLASVVRLEEDAESVEQWAQAEHEKAWEALKQQHRAGERRRHSGIEGLEP